MLTISKEILATGLRGDDGRMRSRFPAEANPDTSSNVIDENDERRTTNSENILFIAHPVIDIDPACALSLADSWATNDGGVPSGTKKNLNTQILLTSLRQRRRSNNLSLYRSTVF